MRETISNKSISGKTSLYKDFFILFDSDFRGSPGSSPCSLYGLGQAFECPGPLFPHLEMGAKENKFPECAYSSEVRTEQFLKEGLNGILNSKEDQGALRRGICKGSMAVCLNEAS